MKIWLLNNPQRGQDVYSSMIVYAATEEDAKSIHPESEGVVGSCGLELLKYDAWTTKDKVIATYLGEAAHITEPNIIIRYYES